MPQLEFWACAGCSEYSRIFFARYTMADADSPQDTSHHRHMGWAPWAEETGVDTSWCYCASCGRVRDTKRITVVHDA